MPHFNVIKLYINKDIKHCGDNKNMKAYSVNIMVK